jgi:crotonobetainyl-CoA:carnitine CoA-transferase CaiB-like acyl-CoA transferase
MVALLERERSGQGQWVQTSLLQAQIFMLDFQAARWLIKHDVAGQAGNNHPTSIPTGVFKTIDGHINVACAGQKIWERFCQAVGAQWLVDSPDYATAAARLKNRDTLNAEIDKLLSSRSSADWVDALNEAGVPCGPIYSIDQVFSDRQVEHLGIAQSVVKPNGETLNVVGQPMTLSRTPSRIASPPPEIGEQTDEVLKEFGYTDGEIAALRQADAV